MKVPALVVATLLSTTAFSPAAAEPGNPEVDAGTHSFLAQFEAATPDISSSPVAPTSGSGTSSPLVYSYEPLCQRNDGVVQPTAYGCGDAFTCGADGLLHEVLAHEAQGIRHVGTTCIEPGDPIAAATAPVLTPGRILEAFRRIPLPDAPLQIQPPGGETLVNFDTILHTQAEPFQETVQLLGRQITFDITPATFTWTLGNGQTMTTTDPGQPWTPGTPMDTYVSHRYTQAGPVTLQLTTTWTARWRLGTGPWRDVNGTVTMTSPAQDLQVRTAQPQLVSYD
ncbi:hypothetical protein BKA08_001784 [Nocardioides marinisabuli]|uniref:PKD domain-containing protein n=1 Tax=Nocardioides marinisabuli TaxID=419476 RepID=A0A7Y9JQS7_9ACTN|nr:hypothetical protein [Nocardioides marinisabuli]NYD57546.1 hypothetical protein [Nocardioides marinisabuli]